MSRFKIYLLSLVCCLLAAGSSFAAVKLLSESDFGVAARTQSAANTPSPAADSCDYDAYPDDYPSDPADIKCSYESAKGGRACVTKNYCQGNTPVTVSECPDSSALPYQGTSSDIISGAGMEYCCGYRNGSGSANTCYFREHPNTCKFYGISDSYSTGSSSEQCTTSGNLVGGDCRTATVDNSYTTIGYCKLKSISGYAACSGTPGTDWDYLQRVSCDDGSTPVVCYHSCGSAYCAGFSCGVGQLPLCNALIAEMTADGSRYEEVSAAASGDVYRCLPTVGASADQVKYLKFGCPASQYPVTGACTDGSVSTATCTIAETAVFNACACPDSFTTLDGYCNTKPDKQSCLTDYYCPNSDAINYCSFDKVNGVAVEKCLSSKFDNSVQLCSKLDSQYAKYTKPEDDDCLDDGTEATCRVDNDFILNQEDVCLYCKDYIANNESDAQNLCGAGVEPVECSSYPTDEITGKYYSSCDCEGSGFSSVKDYCDNLYSTDAEAAQECYIFAEGDAKAVCHTRPKKIVARNSQEYYSDDVVLYKEFNCKEGYVTQEKWCELNADKIIEGYDCMEDYVGLGVACALDAEEGNKYQSYSLKCPDGAYEDSATGCLLDGEEKPEYKYCYVDNGKGVYTESSKKYLCRCPTDYVTKCDNSYEILSGTRCSYDINASGTSVTKYAECKIACGGKYAPSYAKEISGCDDIDAYVSSVRGTVENPQTCAISGSDPLYICACPTNFLSLADWCIENYKSEGLPSENECIENYKGMGTECAWDIETDTAGNPVATKSKFAYYVRYCPNDRPLYYTEQDCRYIGGEYSYSCVNNNTERVVCQCSSSWYNAEPEPLTESGGAEEGEEGSEGEEGTENTEEEEDSTGTETSSKGRSCYTQTLGDIQFDAEASGDSCDFDGTDNLKYKDCVAKCSDMLAEDGIAHPNAYSYLSSDSSTPTQNRCTTLMGNGAVLGYGDQAYCSLNHTIMYPCYCPKDMVECLPENNEQSAEGASVCSINGKTYYSKCERMRCPVESATMAIVPTTTDVEETFGDGATYSTCKGDDGTEKFQVTCDAGVYVDPCEYPYEAPREGSANDSWCKLGYDGKNMADGKPFYKKGACRVKKTLGECGKSIAGDETTTYTMFVANKESDCVAKYGPGIKTQLCEYGADQGYKRAYNCYYDPSAFKYDTSNCGVRHDLTGNYIIINGKKKWNQCNCAKAYQHHRFNCGGMLSGNPCQQEISQSLIDSDATLQDAVADGYELKGITLPFYPYCECSADYTEICDEDGSGRYKGVGTACNGKYTACECVPDELPSGWTDNYYGCEGGKKPTGVWKDNGCGKKYYQCTVVECTWEYTEMCEAPLIPVGDPCQDNEGKIGGYKRCSCPVDYKTCPAGQVGEGEPCNLKGVSYYKSCKSQETCSSIANETCTGPLQIGVNPCLKDDITYYESCVCANGYDKVCGEGEVGVGNACEINGVKHYKECIKPESNICTSGHVTACDTNQESYSPCVDIDDKGKQVVKYLCRCPGNWYTGNTCTEGTLEGETCTQRDVLGNSETYYSKCTPANECSNYQNLTYSVCSESQTGDGGSCVQTSTIVGEDGTSSEQIVIKHATCKDSNNCVSTGFKYSCSGYDVSALGESCVDANGNKLYKECPCPSGYTTCSNPNATKGNKCIPLLANGSFGATQYSSCACDRSKYKYTCEAEEVGNKGIKAPNTSNFCEIEEEKQDTTTDEEGNTITTTVTVKTKYYTSCECQDKYKYTCSNTAGGEVLPSGYGDDYCQINDTKFYKGCSCREDIYKVTADDCAANAGQIVDTSSAPCTIRGIVPLSYSGGEDGEVSTIYTETSYKETLYRQCTCRKNFNLKCDGTDPVNYPEGYDADMMYDQTDVKACQLDASSAPTYSQCKCKSEMKKNCKPSGYNQGITSGDTCLALVSDGQSIVQTPMASSCACKPEYILTCDINQSASDYTKWVQSSQYYCETGNDDSEGSVRKYAKCVCNSNYDTKSFLSGTTTADACDGGSVRSEFDNAGLLTEDAYCTEYSYDASKADSGYISEVIRPNRNLCCYETEDLDGYKSYAAGSFSGLTDLINTVSEEALMQDITLKCGHAYNATFRFDCNGNVYYKCSDATVASTEDSVNIWYTEAECKSTGKNRVTSGTSRNIAESWMQEAKVYATCDCPSKYQYASDGECQNYYLYNKNKLWCTYSARSTAATCPQQILKLYSGDMCTFQNGTTKSSRCVCKQGGEPTGNNACISDCCGDPSGGDDDYACWIAGIPEINGGRAIRVSAYNGGGAGNDKTCNCPYARTSADLNGCSGNGGCSASSCTYARVVYPES